MGSGASPSRASSEGQGLFAGFAWMVVAGLLVKAAALGAHIVLGWLLSPTDFGLYALAAGLYVLLQALQSGGVRVALVTKGRDAAARELKNALLVSAATHVTIASVLWVGAPTAASIYREPPLIPLLRIMAVAVALNVVWVVGGAVLQNGQQFRRLAGIELADGVAKAVLTIVFAASGLGAMSLVLPLPILALFRMLAGLQAIVREWNPEQLPARKAGRLARDGGWIVAATLAHALLTQGDYLGLGIGLSTSLLGIYYFAYQVPGQLGSLLAVKLGDVLVPGLVARRDSGRAGDLVEMTIAQLTAALTLVGCVLAATFPYLEAILWQGRWEAAVAPAQALSLLLVLRLLHMVPKSMMQAQRRFAELFVWTLLAGVGLLGVAAVVGVLTTNMTVVATVLGTYLAVVTLLFLIVALRSTSTDVGSSLRRVTWTWGLSTGITVSVIVTQDALPAVNPWIAAPTVGALTGGLVIGSWRLLAPSAYIAFRSILRRAKGLATEVYPWRRSG